MLLRTLLLTASLASVNAMEGNDDKRHKENHAGIFTQMSSSFYVYGQIDLSNLPFYVMPDDIMSVTYFDSAHTLNMVNCQLSLIPEDLFKFQKLSNLNLSKNHIKTIEDKVALIPRLKHFDLSDNPIDESQTILVGPLLEELFLENCNLTKCPKILSIYLKESPCIKKLSFYNNRIANINNEFISVLESLPNLKKLDLSKNPLSEESKLKLEEFKKKNPSVTIFLNREIYTPISENGKIPFVEYEKYIESLEDF